MLAGASTAAAHYWISDYVEQQGVNELNISAKRVIALTEERIDRTIEALEELAQRNVHSCADADRDAMHEVSFRTVPVKEVSIVGADGRTRCTNLACPVRPAQCDLGRRSRTREPDVVIEVMRSAERQGQLRSRPPRDRRRGMARSPHPRRHAAAAHFAHRRARRRYCEPCGKRRSRDRRAQRRARREGTCRRSSGHEISVRAFRDLCHGFDAARSGARGAIRHRFGSNNRNRRGLRADPCTRGLRVIPHA